MLLLDAIAYPKLNSHIYFLSPPVLGELTFLEVSLSSQNKERGNPQTGF